MMAHPYQARSQAIERVRARSAASRRLPLFAGPGAAVCRSLHVPSRHLTTHWEPLTAHSAGFVGDSVRLPGPWAAAQRER